MGFHGVNEGAPLGGKGERSDGGCELPMRRAPAGGKSTLSKKSRIIVPHYGVGLPRPRGSAS